MTTMNQGEQLPLELIFEADGHVTDVALACLADGELALLPEAALDHVTACAGCARRLGGEALLSVGVTEALRAPGALVTMGPQAAPNPASPVAALIATGRDLVDPVPAPVSAVVSSRRRRPLPIAAIAAALAVAALASWPSIVEGVQGIPSMVTGAASSLPFALHVGLSFLRSAPWGLGGAAIAIRWISAVVFVAVGLSVARAHSRWGHERPHPGAR